MIKNFSGKNHILCFAYLSQYKCNALVWKKCENCKFYKPYYEVNGYEKYLPKGFQRHHMEM